MPRTWRSFRAPGEFDPAALTSSGVSRPVTAESQMAKVEKDQRAKGKRVPGSVVHCTELNSCTSPPVRWTAEPPPQEKPPQMENIGPEIVTWMTLAEGGKILRGVIISLLDFYSFPSQQTTLSGSQFSNMYYN